MSHETTDEQAKRVRQRALFDSVADLYDDTRVGYPGAIIDELFTIAELHAGSPVLEVGCGTGQLTVDLARRAVQLTAIDLGASMVAATAEKVAKHGSTVQHSPFEEFEAPESSFAAVVSATAFHWIDPDVAWTKSAALLQPGGWIAILATGERYDEPLGGAFHAQWIRYSDDGGAWATARRPTLAESIAATGLFNEAVTSEHRARRTMTADTMVRLEQTRATTLSYDPDTRDRFFAELRELLGGLEHVTLTQETTLTMAQVKSSDSRWREPRNAATIGW